MPQGSQPANDGSEDSIYQFEQQVPIPSYLFAVASGEIVSAQVGPRSSIWTGPLELDDFKWEMEGDTEKYIEIVEKLIYPYAWGKSIAGALSVLGVCCLQFGRPSKFRRSLGRIKHVFCCPEYDMLTLC